MRALPVVALCLLSLASCIDSEFIANQMVKTGTMEDMNKAFFMEDSPAHAGAAPPGRHKKNDGVKLATPAKHEHQRRRRGAGRRGGSS